MGSFCKPIQHQNSTKSKYRKSSTVVTGECSNNVKETGMAGIWSGAFTRRQMWGGGRETRSEEWELHGCALRSAFLPRCSWHTHMHTYMRAPTHSWIIQIVNRNKCHAHTHTRRSDTQQLKASADGHGLCPWLQEVKAGDRGRKSEREVEDGWARRGLCRGKTVQWTGTLTKDYFLNTELRHRG